MLVGNKKYIIQYRCPNNTESYSVRNINLLLKN